jgi:aspartokinase-like uncharacterized kinase
MNLNDIRHVPGQYCRGGGFAATVGRCRTVREMEAGEFEYLEIAPGGMIFADALRSMERSGLMSPDEADTFMAYMSARYG